MKNILGIFIKGLLLLTPVLLTFFILYKIYAYVDGIFRGPLEQADLYFPGLGLLLALALVFLTGLLASYWVTGRLLAYFDRLLTRVPLLGTVYAIIKDTVQSFGTSKKGFGQVVRVRLPNGPTVLGFLTRERDPVFLPPGHVAVYFMQSMQWAGHLLLVPREWVEPVDASTEDALKFIASAGLLKSKDA